MNYQNMTILELIELEEEYQCYYDLYKNKLKQYKDKYDNKMIDKIEYLKLCDEINIHFLPVKNKKQELTHYINNRIKCENVLDDNDFFNHDEIEYIWNCKGVD